MELGLALQAMGARAPRLIGLLAAHFSAFDHARVDRLRRLLQSVEGQTHRIPLLASWSAEDAGPREVASETAAGRAEAVFAEFGRRGVVRAMPRLRGRHAQFEHYSRLNDLLQRHSGDAAAGEPRPMVVFTDDDDIWHPQRAEEYLVAAAAQPDADVLASRAHASPGLSPRLRGSATAEEVTRRLADGQFRLSVSAERPEAGLFGTATGEYFDIAASPTVLADFFSRHNKRLVANQFADIRFRTCLLKWRNGVYRFLPRRAGGGVGAESAPDVRWMYFYDRTTEPYTTPAGEEDMQYLCDELPDINRIAGMRQTLDCVIFQLAPTDGPLRISEQDFAERLVGMLVNQGPATVRMALDRCLIHGIGVGDRRGEV